MAQCYALLRRGELHTARIGARGDYRIGRDDREAYIERTYAETERLDRRTPRSVRMSSCRLRTEPRVYSFGRAIRRQSS